MSINSLVNFGVPGQGGERTPVIQPIFANRFRVVFYNFGRPGDTAPYDMTRAVKSVGRPKAQFNEAPLHSYHSISYVTGRGEWDPIQMRFREDIDNQALERIAQQASKQMNFFDQTASRAGQNYKFEIDIDILAGGATAGTSAQDPNILQKWCLAGCWLKDYDLGELTYERAEPTEITCNIRFDNAVCYDGEGNRLGDFDHGPEIDTRTGVFSTGIGGAGA